LRKSLSRLRKSPSQLRSAPRSNPQSGSKRVVRVFKYKQVIVARADLKMSPGKLAVQVAHGSVAAAEKARSERRDWFKAWLAEGQKKVVVKALADEIHQLHDQASELGIPSELIQDAGLTELPPGTITVLAIGPAPNELVDKLTRKLPLL
jgi:PTH2 family peptidyl-tRNA hydrolase